MEQKYKILVVEDDELIRTIYSDRFSREDSIQVDVAIDGLDGLNKIKQNKYDLIFSGIQMPNKTGFELFQDLQQNKNWSKIPFVIFSHLGRAEDMQKARELGINNFIIRGNTSPNELTQRIKDILNESYIGEDEMDKGYHILVVEDDPDIRSVYVERFQQQSNFTIEEAVDGLDGINKAKSKHYDLIISGIQMPNKTGFDLFQELQAIPEYSNVPIVLFSHLGRAEDIANAKKLSVKHFIIRGQNSPNDILNRIRDILHSKDKTYSLILKKDSPDYDSFIESFFGKDCIEYKEMEETPIKVILSQDSAPYNFSIELDCSTDKK